MNDTEIYILCHFSYVYDIVRECEYESCGFEYYLLNGSWKRKVIQREILFKGTMQEIKEKYPEYLI